MTKKFCDECGSQLQFVMMRGRTRLDTQSQITPGKQWTFEIEEKRFQHQTWIETPDLCDGCRLTLLLKAILERQEKIEPRTSKNTTDPPADADR